jgi:hypothetical protein
MRVRRCKQSGVSHSPASLAALSCPAITRHRVITYALSGPHVPQAPNALSQATSCGQSPKARQYCDKPRR